MATYSIFDVANWFLGKEPMNHVKLQKLCYYAVAWGYALFNRPICAESEFQAWINGPVSPTLYEKYKKTGWKKHNQDDGLNFPLQNSTHATRLVLNMIFRRKYFLHFLDIANFPDKISACDVLLQQTSIRIVLVILLHS